MPVVEVGSMCPGRCVVDEGERALNAHPSRCGPDDAVAKGIPLVPWCGGHADAGDDEAAVAPVVSRRRVRWRAASPQSEAAQEDDLVVQVRRILEAVGRDWHERSKACSCEAR